MNEEKELQNPVPEKPEQENTYVSDKPDDLSRIDFDDFLNDFDIDELEGETDNAPADTAFKEETPSGAADSTSDDFEEVSPDSFDFNDLEPEFGPVKPADFKINDSARDKEVFSGVLSREEEERLYTAVNIPAIPKPVSELRSESERYEKNSEKAAPAEDDISDKEKRKLKFKKGMRIFWKIWKYVRVPIIIGATLLITYFVLLFIGKKLYNNYLMPVDPKDSTPIVVTIPEGSGASAIAKILYEAGGEGEPGLISHKAVFKVYVDFIGKSSRLQAGTYVLSRNMSIPDIVDVICRGEPPRETVKLKVVEGMTIEGMANKLVEDGILSSPDRFLELCVTGETFVKAHPFIADIPVDETGERRYVLEGFLFPDTYEIYVGANEETIIDKMLTRFEQIFGTVYSKRAKELNLSVYEVITLASTIEKEARLNVDFAKVSAVFYNRIEENMSLDSDATLEYILKTGSLSLTEEQLATPSGYNTHINQGLPLGPVSNPGDAAINAALYPNSEFINDGYLYFCLMDSKTGALVYAKTLSEHNENVAKYRPNW